MKIFRFFNLFVGLLNFFMAFIWIFLMVDGYDKTLGHLFIPLFIMLGMVNLVFYFQRLKNREGKNPFKEAIGIMACIVLLGLIAPLIDGAISSQGCITVYREYDESPVIVEEGGKTSEWTLTYGEQTTYCGTRLQFWMHNNLGFDSLVGLSISMPVREVYVQIEDDVPSNIQRVFYLGGEN